MHTLKIQDVIKELEALRTNDSVIHDWYVQAEAIGTNIDVMPDVPRTVSQQLSRDMTMLNMLHQRNITIELLRYPCWIIQYSK